MIKNMVLASILRKMDAGLKEIGHMGSNMAKETFIFRMAHSSKEFGAMVKESNG